MTDQIIIIHGGAYTDVKKALLQWITLYSQQLEEDYRFELYKNARGQHIILVDKRVDNEKFCFLVNYLKYPEGIDYKINVEGFTTIADSTIFPPDKTSLEVLLFIPDDDKEFDNVYAVTPQNEVFKIAFSGKTTKVPVAGTFRRPDFNPATLPAPEIIHPKRVSEKSAPTKNKKTVSGDDFSKRFNIILLLIVVLFLLSYFKFSDTRSFFDINFGISLLVGLWFFLDYKMLQSNTWYLRCLVLSLAILLYGYFLQRYLSGGIMNYVAPATDAPLFFLVIQRSLRFLFKSMLKREPVVERPAPSAADFIYMLVVIFINGFLFFLLNK